MQVGLKSFEFFFFKKLMTNEQQTRCVYLADSYPVPESVTVDRVGSDLCVSLLDLHQSVYENNAQMPQTALSQQHSNSGSRQRGGNKGWRVDEARERGTHSSPSLLILFYGCSLSDLHLRLSGNLTLMSLPAPWPGGAISTCIFCRTAERVSYFNSLEQSIVTDFQAPVSCNTPPNTLVGGEVKRWIVTLLINIHYHGCQLAHVVSDNTPSNANG